MDGELLKETIETWESISKMLIPFLPSGPPKVPMRAIKHLHDMQRDLEGSKTM